MPARGGILLLAMVATQASAPPALDADRLVTDVIATGLVVIAVIAAGGTAFLLLARRRAPRAFVVDDVAAPSPDRAHDPDPTAELLDRRALRRAHLVLEEDPIVGPLVGEHPASAGARPASHPEPPPSPRSGA